MEVLRAGANECGFGNSHWDLIISWVHVYVSISPYLSTSHYIVSTCLCFYLTISQYISLYREYMFMFLSHHISVHLIISWVHVYVSISPYLSTFKVFGAGTVTPSYNMVVGVINEARYRRGALYIYSARGATISPKRHNSNRSQCAGCAVYAWFIKLIDIDNQCKCVLR